MEKLKPSPQTVKRQRCLDLAGEDGMDYLIVWDADDIVHPKYQEWDKFYKSLQRYAKKYPDYHLFQMLAWIPDNKTWRKAWNDSRTNSWKPYARIHKDPGTQRYALDCHYWWCPKDATDEDLIMQRRPMYISDHTIPYVRFTTDSTLRGERQLVRRDDWAWNNICEEQRRSYIKTRRVQYGELSLELDGYWRYDPEGRMMSKICEEDGTPVKYDIKKEYNRMFGKKPIL